MSDSEIIADLEARGIHMPLARPVWDGGRIIAFIPACPCGWTSHFYWVGNTYSVAEARTNARIMAEVHVKATEGRPL